MGAHEAYARQPRISVKCIPCHLCGQEMLGSASRGKAGTKYPAYHCGGLKSGKRAHALYRIPKKTFDDAVAAYLESLKFEDGFLGGLELHLIDQYRTREKEVLVQSSAISHSVGDLKTELAQTIEAFERAESEVMRRSLEAKATKLETQIEQAESERGRIEVSERSIRSFRREAQRVMEHPSEILTNADNLYIRRQLLGLFFDVIPTYQEIVNGTPKLACLFNLSSEYKRTNGQFVTPRGIEPRFTAVKGRCPNR